MNDSECQFMVDDLLSSVADQNITSFYKDAGTRQSHSSQHVHINKSQSLIKF